MTLQKLRIKLAAVAKDEATYLPEWIFHHLEFGFDEIEVYVNNTTDESLSVLNNISQHYPVVVTNADKLFRKAKRFQIQAYQEIAVKAREDGFTHLLFLDIDEFWTPADFSTSIKDAIIKFNFPQVISFNWLVHCDEEEFSSCYKSELKVQANAHVKSIFQLHSPWQTVKVHNVLGEDLTYMRGDGKEFDFGESIYCAITDKNCFEHDYFIIHRMYRSQMEYVSLLGRGRSNKSKIKDNRRGYYKLSDKYHVINFDTRLLDLYYSKFDEFKQVCSLSKLISKSELFIKMRFESVMSWAKEAQKSDVELFFKLFTNIEIPEIVLLRARLNNDKLVAKITRLLGFRCFLSYWFFTVLTKLFYRFKSNKIAKKCAFFAITRASDIDGETLIDYFIDALGRSSYPEEHYFEFFEQVAIYLHKNDKLYLACDFIEEALKLSPESSHIHFLHQLFNDEKQRKMIINN